MNSCLARNVRVVCSIVASMIFTACQGNPGFDQSYVLSVAGADFCIPSGHLWAWDHLREGRITGANLHALYPGFEPKSAENAHVFEAPGWGGGRKITFLIKDGSEKFESHESMIDQIVKREPLNDKSLYGLTSYPSDLESREYLVGSMREGVQVYFSCAGKLSVPFPSCWVRFPLNGSIDLHLTFSRSLLPEWKDLLIGLIETVEGFRVDNLDDN